MAQSFLLSSGMNIELLIDKTLTKLPEVKETTLTPRHSNPISMPKIVINITLLHHITEIKKCYCAVRNETKALFSVSKIGC